MVVSVVEMDLGGALVVVVLVSWLLDLMQHLVKVVLVRECEVGLSCLVRRR